MKTTSFQQPIIKHPFPLQQLLRLLITARLLPFLSGGMHLTDTMAIAAMKN